ncbi:nucleoside deaminase [bacterium]|nr:nucleoside deaminase [bacterium]MBP3847475.1 nucleoside deaminase [bacterium]
MSNYINKYMQKALEQARQTEGEIPVGAVIVHNGKIIAQANNRKEADKNVTSHAEILAIKTASEHTGNWRLEDCDMYVTLEPCPMCGWAILQSRIKNLYFGSYDNQYGAFSIANLNKISDSKTKVFGGICEDECDEMLKFFFNRLRK